MADVDFTFSDDQELVKLSNDLYQDPEDFEKWEKLVRAAEAQEGGLNRNSSPQAITAVRQVYDQFLARYPLFYGFWKRYADLEFAIAGTEAAEMVYERGVASVGTSVDLWANYCGFKVETNHEVDAIRELFERGAESCGQDFLAHPFWDKYIEFEERHDAELEIFKILARVIRLPLHQYSRYFERFKVMSQRQDVANLVEPDVLLKIQAEVLDSVANPADHQTEVRTRIDAMHWELFQRTQAEVTKRWTFEQNIKRPYYHVTELDEEQQANWEKYLDSEEAEGDYARTKFLYERCLVTAANYDHFWFRYIRWLSAQKGKEEEIRSAYQRASFVYVPIALPSIRLHWAKFEEAQGRPEVATDIHEAILDHVPTDLPTIISLANLHRRQYGAAAAVAVLDKWPPQSIQDVQVEGALVAECARIAWRTEGDIDGARKLFSKAETEYLDCQPLWAGWLSFEIDLFDRKEDQTRSHKRILAVHNAIRQKSTLPPAVVKMLSSQYMQYLEQCGGKDAMKELLQLDVQINGPDSVANALNGVKG